jgi:hypothetical protein
MHGPELWRLSGYYAQRQVDRGAAVEPKQAQDKRTRRLAMNRRRLRLREIDRRLRAEYEVYAAAGLPSRLAALIEQVKNPAMEPEPGSK